MPADGVDVDRSVRPGGARCSSRRPFHRLHVLPREWARLKPDPRHLTLYYCMISAAGAAAGGARGGDRREPRCHGYYEDADRRWCCWWSFRGARLPTSGLVRSRMAVGCTRRARLVRLGLDQGLTQDVRVMERTTSTAWWHQGPHRGVPAARPCITGDQHGGAAARPKLSRNPSTTSANPRLGSVLREPAGGTRAAKRRRCDRPGRRATLAPTRTPGDHWVFYAIAPTVLRVAQTEFQLPQAERRGAAPRSCSADGRLSMERESARLRRC